MEKLDVQIQPKLKKIALYTLIFMALLHGYRYVSLGFSHDSLTFAWQPDLEWQISLGRYMQPFYWWIIRGRIAAPFIVGVLSYGYMVGSVYGVASLLDLKAKTSLFLLAGLMCGSLAFIALDATYSHTADVYMLALMLNIAAAWLCLRGRRRVPSVLAAVVLLVISTGLYQAYLQVFTALTMVWALLRLLKTDDRAIPEAAARCAQSFLALMLAMALFFVGYYVVMAVTGVEAVSKANSIGGMKVLSGAALVDMVKTTWKMPLRQLGRLQGRIAPLARMLTAVVLMTGAAATISASVTPAAVSAAAMAVSAPVMLESESESPSPPERMRTNTPTETAFSGTSEKYVSASGRESASSIAVPRSTPSAVNIPSVSPSVSSSPSTTQLSPGTANAAVVSSSNARIQEMSFFKKRLTSRK